MNKRLTATIHGRVQGVAFRHYTTQEARHLALRGWVKNNRDGTVSVVAEGRESDLRQLEQWLQHGPPAARVTQVEAQWGEDTAELTQFMVRYG